MNFSGWIDGYTVVPLKAANLLGVDIRGQWDATHEI